MCTRLQKVALYVHHLLVCACSTFLTIALWWSCILPQLIIASSPLFNCSESTILEVVVVPEVPDAEDVDDDDDDEQVTI
jgi:hypothetical protein